MTRISCGESIAARRRSFSPCRPNIPARCMQLVAQPELDKDALRLAVKDARDKRLKIGDVVIETFVEMLEQISPKGRRQLVGGFLR